MTPMNKNTRMEKRLAVGLMALLLLGCLMVMRPFLSALLWAVVLCFSLWPIHRRLTAWLRGRRTLAAALSTLAVTLVLVVPLVIIGFRIADDARALASATRKWVDDGPPAAPGWLEKIPLLGRPAKFYWGEFAEDTARLLQQLKTAADAQQASTNAPVTENAETPPATTPTTTAPTPGLADSKLIKGLGKVIGGAQSKLISIGLAIGRGIIEVGLSVFLVFFLLRDGEEMARRLTTGITRIAGEKGRHLLDVAGNTVRGVVYGILGTALAQGGLAGLGFLIAGVPGAALLGLLTFFLSVVPMGPPLVWVPATIWLFQQGRAGWGVFMLVWGLLVSSVDNIVKPWLISQGSNMPFILIFFGVLGGALAFGFIGVFLGPTLLAVAYRIVEEWSRLPVPETTAALAPGAPAESAAEKASGQ